MVENIFISRYYCAKLIQVKQIICVVEIFKRLQIQVSTYEILGRKMATHYSIEAIYNQLFYMFQYRLMQHDHNNMIKYILLAASHQIIFHVTQIYAFPAASEGM